MRKIQDQQTITVGTLSADAMWADFASRTAVREQPPGSMSVYQFAEKFNVQVTSARTALKTAERLGKATSELVLVLEGTQPRRIRFYTLKKL